MKTRFLIFACTIIVGSYALAKNATTQAHRQAPNLELKKPTVINLDFAEDNKIYFNKLTLHDIASDPVLAAKYRVYQRKVASVRGDLPEP